MQNKNYEISFFIGILLLAIALVFYIFYPYLSAIVLAVSLAVLFHPVYLLILKYFPKHSGMAAAFTVLAALVIILMPLIFFGFRIFQETQGLYLHFTSGNKSMFTDFISNGLGKYFPWLSIDVTQYIKQSLSLLLKELGPFFSGLSNMGIVMILTLFSFYYLLKDSSNLKIAILKISPLSRDHTAEIISKLIRTAKSIIKGSLLIAAAQGIIVGIGFFFFGLSNPVLWGSVAIFASLIPVVGTALVIIPGMISLFLLGNMFGTAGLALWCFPLILLIDNFLRPHLVDKDLKIHPVLVLFSVIGGLAVFGPMGLLLGPLALSFLIALLDIYPKLITRNES
jgi:predicted PurR-regulated permease PerM